MSLAKLHTKGLPPLEEPVAGAAIEERLREERERRDAEHAEARPDDPARLRASDAYACSRKIAFGSLGIPKDITYDAATLMTFRAGDWYHQLTQEALTRSLDARCEVDFDWRPSLSLWGKCDGVYGDTAVEIKSQAGYGFDLATGARRSSDGPGPKVDHLIQVGLAALSPQIQAERVHVIYINKDRGVVAEWIVGVDEELPHLEGATVRHLVQEEVVRLTRILEILDEGLLPKRWVPGFGVVEVPPMPGSRDDPWPCRYCAWNPTCTGLPTGRVRFTRTDDGVTWEEVAE